MKTVFKSLHILSQCSNFNHDLKEAILIIYILEISIYIQSKKAQKLLEFSKIQFHMQDFNKNYINGYLLNEFANYIISLKYIQFQIPENISKLETWTTKFIMFRYLKNCVSGSGNWSPSIPLKKIMKVELFWVKPVSFANILNTF